jgi:hypothetical protein
MLTPSRLIAPPPPLISVLSAISIATELSAASSAFAAAGWPGANRALYIPVYLDQPITVAKLWTANGGTASGNVDIGIFDASLARLVSSGSTAQAGTNVLQAFDIADTYLAGPALYYVGLSASAIAATFWRTDTGTIPKSKLWGVAQEAAAFPLPATATLAALASGFIPLCGMATRTLVA